jgi:hypothetical protein
MPPETLGVAWTWPLDMDTEDFRGFLLWPGFFTNTEAYPYGRG